MNIAYFSIETSPFLTGKIGNSLPIERVFSLLAETQNPTLLRLVDDGGNRFELLLCDGNLSPTPNGCSLGDLDNLLPRFKRARQLLFEAFALDLVGESPGNTVRLDWILNSSNYQMSAGANLEI